MKVGIVGAGWAGLSAAVRVADLGHDVTIFEASSTLGGRARAVDSPRLQVRIDNGQHIMLGAYRETLSLMTRLGIDTRQTLQREALALESADGTFCLRVPRLPSPLHLMVSLVRARGLTLNEKWGLVRTIRQLKTDRWHVIGAKTVQQWLTQHQQSAHVQALFWQPLCIAALNTPIADACAQLFSNVLRDSLGDSTDASDILIPKVDLSALWPDRVEHRVRSGKQKKIRIRRRVTVRHLAFENAASLTDDGTCSGATSGHDGVLINDERFDAVILACNVPSSRRLLAQLPVTGTNACNVQTLLDSLSDFTYIPIVTATLKLARRWNLPHSMYLLREDRQNKHYGQWLFNSPAFMLAQSWSDSTLATVDKNAATLTQIVISDAQAALTHEDTRLIELIKAQLKAQTARFGTMPDVTAWSLIAEKRATFAATPRLRRPDVATPWPQVWLAGDWTNTGYPAVLEGAVRSGQHAALGVHQMVAQNALK